MPWRCFLLSMMQKQSNKCLPRNLQDRLLSVQVICISRRSRPGEPMRSWGSRSGVNWRMGLLFGQICCHKISFFFCTKGFILSKVLKVAFGFVNRARFAAVYGTVTFVCWQKTEHACGNTKFLIRNEFIKKHKSNGLFLNGLGWGLG